MSFIAYMNGVLLADRVGITLDGEMARVFEMKKLHVSKCNRFAFAYCGNRLVQGQLDELEVLINNLLTMSIVNKTPYVLEPDARKERDEAHALLGHQKIIIVTENRVYEASKKFSGVLTAIELTDFHSDGTYKDAFYTAAMITQKRQGRLLDEKEMVAVASDTIGYISGQDNPVIDSIALAMLLPFVATEVPAAPKEEV